MRTPCFGRLRKSVPVQDFLSIKRGGSQKGVKVSADRAIKEGEVMLVPLIPTASRVSTKCQSSFTLKAKVTGVGGWPAELFILGASTLPPCLAPMLVGSGSGTASNSSGEVLDCHEWKSSHFPWPFWLVKWVENEADANCKFVSVLSRAVYTMTVPDSEVLVDTFDVMLPTMTNFKAVKAGEELVVHWTSSHVQKPSKSKSTTWMDAATREAKKRRV